MPEIIISLPEELEEEFKNVMPAYWQLALEKRIREELNDLARLKGIVSKSRLTEKDASELADELSASLSERFLKGKK